MALILLALSTTTSSTLPEQIVRYANIYNVSATTMTDIIECESGGDPNIQSFVIDKKGKREDSWGLVQIHLPDHPEVTKEQATDADFSLDFLAYHLSTGQGSMWSCFRQISP